MATALIPEVIQPGDLYVPSINNFFSISSGTMPNTDDALICDGASGNFRAYQPAISDIHYPATPTQDHSVAFWAWSAAAGAGGSGGAFYTANVIMSVMDPTLATGGTSQATTVSTTGFRWGLSSATTSASKDWYFNEAIGASGAGARVAPGLGIAGSTWKGLCYRHGAALGATSWQTVDFVLNNLNTVTATAGTPGTVTAPNFSIGPYSQLTGWDAWNAVLRLAKIAIYPTHYLTDTEILALYDSMMSGPPSP
jgi:hypothetical protein